MSSYETPVRWRDDVGWEKRCDECAKRDTDARFWPLTLEFWNPKKSMRRCRSCQRALEAKAARAKYLANTTFRERRLNNARKYRAEVRGTLHVKDAAKWAATKADPLLLEQARERGRKSQAAYRARKRAEKAA